MDTASRRRRNLRYVGAELPAPVVDELHRTYPHSTHADIFRRAIDALLEKDQSHAEEGMSVV
jgi:hypothetical protein